MPGEYAAANVNINGVAGNGLVNTNAERGLFWNHLSAAGFITGNFDGTAQGNNLNCPSTRCPTNAYGAPMVFSISSFADGTNRNAHELRTGRSIPVDVMAEHDRKVHDGVPRTGTFQADQQVNANTCRQGARINSIWLVISNNPESDCGGVHIM